ncbi:Na+/H+ antiporter subunit D [Domibacillus epiphyticus]|uniref:Na+/H+ antiporter subunit D n=1 Tax=Domibacillus epiphyticus TaxID=1714355 RepID=A0A1V2AA26_9BACI|nr:Na+/H+ antiporter subunit D [Domibacillus epiphyticus]OMP67790.1 Na+/H+ antiporter subunit D [Domibacillus epiphyticus]
MINLPILPILIPLVAAIILIFLAKSIYAQRIVSVIASIATIISSIMIMAKVKSDGIQTVDMGSWPAPFGITLVSDMLSVLLVLTASVITLCVILYSFRSIGNGRERFYYYPIVQFLLLGVNGSFTTGDIFNLFVFFEIMLMSSYVLIVIGGTKIQLRESIKYILVNVISSAIFVMAVGFLYSVTGSLNMAHISARISEIGSEPIITVLAVLFLIVFGLKGAIFPLYFWLPGSYSAPPAPILALFGSLLTKVGIYAILRTYTLFFYHDQPFTHDILSLLALLTIVAGVIGALAYRDVKQILIYNIIIAVGVLLFGIATMTDESLAGTVFYLIHDMIIKAALFLLGGIIIYIAGTSNLNKMGGLILQYPALGWTFLLASFALAGIPPLSGFTGKLLIVRSGFAEGEYVGAIVVLLSSLAVLYSVVNLFMGAFWKTTETPLPDVKKRTGSLFIPVVVLVLLSVLYGVGTEFVYPYVMHAVDVLIHPEIYIDAVLKE